VPIVSQPGQELVEVPEKQEESHADEADMPEVGTIINLNESYRSLVEVDNTSVNLREMGLAEQYQFFANDVYCFCYLKKFGKYQTFLPRNFDQNYATAYTTILNVNHIFFNTKLFSCTIEFWDVDLSILMKFSKNCLMIITRLDLAEIQHLFC
jgi:hypothetical protein